MFDKHENKTILHTVSDETMEKVKRAHKATTEAQFVIDQMTTWVESLKASANKMRQEAFIAASDEFPGLSDPNNSANLDFETGNITTPNANITDPIGQGLEVIKKIIGDAIGGNIEGASIITGTQEEILNKLRQKMEGAGITQEDDDDKKKVLN